MIEGMNGRVLSIPIMNYCSILLSSIRSSDSYSRYDFISKKVKKFFSTANLTRNINESTYDYYKMMISQYSKSNDVSSAINYIVSLLNDGTTYEYISRDQVSEVLSSMSGAPEVTDYGTDVILVRTSTSTRGNASDEVICSLCELLVEMFSFDYLVIVYATEPDPSQHTTLLTYNGTYSAMVHIDGKYDYHVELSSYTTEVKCYIDYKFKTSTPTLSSTGVRVGTVLEYYVWLYPGSGSFQLSLSKSTLMDLNSSSLKKYFSVDSIEVLSEKPSDWQVSEFSGDHKSIESSSGSDKGSYNLVIIKATPDFSRTSPSSINGHSPTSRNFKIHDTQDLVEAVVSLVYDTPFSEVLCYAPWISWPGDVYGDSANVTSLAGESRAYLNDRTTRMSSAWQSSMSQTGECTFTYDRSSSGPNYVIQYRVDAKNDSQYTKYSIDSIVCTNTFIYQPKITFNYATHDAGWYENIWEGGYQRSAGVIRPSETINDSIYDYGTPEITVSGDVVTIKIKSLVMEIMNGAEGYNNWDDGHTTEYSQERLYTDYQHAWLIRIKIKAVSYTPGTNNVATTRYDRVWMLA